MIYGPTLNICNFQILNSFWEYYFVAKLNALMLSFFIMFCHVIMWNSYNVSPVLIVISADISFRAILQIRDNLNFGVMPFCYCTFPNYYDQKYQSPFPWLINYMQLRYLSD